MLHSPEEGKEGRGGGEGGPSKIYVGTISFLPSQPVKDSCLHLIEYLQAELLSPTFIFINNKVMGRGLCVSMSKLLHVTA